MGKLYIHIGGGKTGSSAIQSFLSANPILQAGKRRVVYTVVDGSGRLLSQDNIKSLAAKSENGYVTSAYDLRMANGNGRLDGLFSHSMDIDYVISHEGWIYSADVFRDLDAVCRFGRPAELIVYVRPHVEWINSAWWQWWVWSRKGYRNPAEAISDLGVGHISWMTHINKWRNVPGVEKITIRLHQPDIIPDFLRVLGIQDAPSSSHRKNVSLGPELLKLLLRFPQFRDIHAGHVDVILARNLEFRGSVPWVLDSALVEKIVEQFRPDAEAILASVDSDLMPAMRADARWWSADAYQSKVSTHQSNFELTFDDCLAILEKVIPALISLDGRARQG